MKKAFVIDAAGIAQHVLGLRETATDFPHTAIVPPLLPPLQPSWCSPTLHQPPAGSTRITAGAAALRRYWRGAYEPNYRDRANGLPFLGLMVGGSISLLLWAALSLGAWKVLMR